jgi:uncharacterized BrkB/YihY/UPF0761 family membrane protein
MYHPQHDRGQERHTHRQEQRHFIRAALRVLTVVLTAVFWFAAAIFAVLLAVPSVAGSIGVDLPLLRGVSYLIVVMSSGAILWIEFASNPTEDAERGEWTSKMLFYGLVFAFTLFVGFYYLPALYFAP